MAKWKCWFGWVKRLFASESNGKKPKKWGRSIGRCKLKQYPPLTAPNRSLTEARAEQKKHALTVAIATAAAAEAAVAAAHAAAEVVRLTGASRSYSYLSKGDRSLAAIKIQSAYRAHLARKALRALKGVVRLQAIVRGQAVRRQVCSKLKHLQSNGRKHAEIMEKSSHAEDESCKSEHFNQFSKQKRKFEKREINPECHSQRTWDCSLHSQEDIETIWLRKQEAIVKRERMKQYSFSHRERKFSHLLEDFAHNKEYGRVSCRTLGQWLDKETCNENLILKTALPWNLITKELHDKTQVMQKNVKEEDSQVGLNLQISFPRKSFSHGKKSLLAEDSSLPNSPVFPSYMAVTESIKAKARSMSTPRQRTEFLDIYTNRSEPHKEGITFWSSSYDTTATNHGNSEVSQKRCNR